MLLRGPYVLDVKRDRACIDAVDVGVYRPLLKLYSDRVPSGRGSRCRSCSCGGRLRRAVGRAIVITTA